MYINIEKEVYDGETAWIWTDKLNEKIKIMKGVRQGDTVPPVIFAIAVEE